MLTTLIKVGANYVVEVERSDENDPEPRLTFYRLEVSEILKSEETVKLVAALTGSAEKAK